MSDVQGVRRRRRRRLLLLGAGGAALALSVQPLVTLAYGARWGAIIRLAVIGGICLIGSAGLGVISGRLVRGQARGCAKRAYARDLSFTFMIPLIVLVAVLLLPVFLVSLLIPDPVLTLTWVLFLFPASIAATIVAHLRASELGTRQRRGQCHACGYDLRGATGDRCPECHAQIDPVTRRRAAAIGASSTAEATRMQSRDGGVM